MFIYVAIAIATLSIFIHAFLNRQRYPDVPTLRVSARPGRWGTMDDIQLWVKDSMKVYQAGYDRYSKHGKHYLYNTPKGKELVVASAFFEELQSAPSGYVSSAAANTETMQFKWTLHENLLFKHFHVDAPLTKLTTSLGARLPDIVEERQLTIDDNIGRPKDWISRHLLADSFRIVTRTANRLLFGLDLARNEEFLQLSIDYTGVMFGGASLIKNYPDFLKSLMLTWKTDIRQAQAIAMKHLVPVFRERLEQKQRYLSQGREDEWKRIKPDDSIQWVLDAAPPDELDFRRLTYRMLHINVAAAHTSTVHFLDMMQVLSLMPEFQKELREEIIEVFQRDGGWTKQTLTHLKKVDSFMTEVARFCSLSAVKPKRVIIKDFRLSDNTLLPKGLTVFANHLPYVMDPDVLSEAETFDPLRMYRKRLEPGQEAMHQWVMFSDLNQTFGAGKHACPGRFFAANEIKTLVVLALMRFEFRMKSDYTLQDIFRGIWHNEVRSSLLDAILEVKKLELDLPEALKSCF